MKLTALSVSAAIALLTGCAASTEPAGTGAEQAEVVASERIELLDSPSVTSIQARLFKLLDTFKADSEIGVVSAIEGSSLMVVGAAETGTPARSVSCDTSDMEAVAPGGGGFMHIVFYGCVLDGFDRIRSGGTLPEVVVPYEGEAPLAGKLFALLEKGEKKGGLGVVRTAGDDKPPPCCDMTSLSAYTISDANGSFSCSMTSGGLIGINRADCTYERKIKPNE